LGIYVASVCTVANNRLEISRGGSGSVTDEITLVTHSQHNYYGHDRPASIGFVSFKTVEHRKTPRYRRSLFMFTSRFVNTFYFVV
jgi:hypothetical protein